MNNSPIIVFDLGKVLVDFDYSIAARRIAARCADRTPQRGVPTILDFKQYE